MSRRTERSAAGQRPGSRSSARGQLARQLWEWATQEMRYTGGEEGTLRQEDLHTLVRGESAGLCEFVVKHVKSASKAEVIRGNLILHSVGGGGGGGGGGEGGRVVMEQERVRLAREEESLKTAVQQMSKDVAQLRESITQLAETNGSVERETARLSRGSALLSAHSHSCQETTRALREFSVRIVARADLFSRPKGRDALYFARKGVSGDEREKEEGRETVLESACTHLVRVICSQLEETLSSSHSQDQSVGERKDQSWKQIESLLSDHKPGEILDSLKEVTKQGTHRLHSHTLSIDLNRDAHQLKYSYDGSGGMRDVSEQFSLLHAVEEQLLEGQLSHIQRSVESESARRSADAARRRASELQNEAVQLLHELYHDQPNSDALELAKVLYTRLELEYAGSQAALERLTTICSSLEEARGQSQTAADELQAKLRTILEFAQVAESKQMQIQALVAHNSAARDRLQKQFTELQVYVEQNVVSHREELIGAAVVLHDSVAREVEAFSHLALDRLLKAPGSELVTCDLSIFRLGGDQLGGDRLGGDQPAGRPPWTEITRSLSLPPHSAADRVLTQLLADQENVGELESEVKEVNKALQQMRVGAVNNEHTQSVLQRCREHDRQLLEKATPALQQCLSRASSGLADCERTAETLEHWWSQPAQFLAPWATHSGVTSEQWVDKWKVLAAKFSELQGH